jgi:hypothetical protein
LIGPGFVPGAEAGCVMIAVIGAILGLGLPLAWQS